MKCICCESDKIELKGRKLGYSIYKCKNCKFEFVFPLPENEELEAFYNSGMKGEAQIRISGVSYSLKDASSAVSHYLSH